MYRFNFASFYIFMGLVNSSAVNVSGSYFLFFKGSWMDVAFGLLYFIFGFCSSFFEFSLAFIFHFFIN